MNAYAASVLLSGAAVCGAHALAGDTAPAPVDPQALHGKLMKECMDKQRSQNDAARPEDAKKLCAVRVKTQLQQLKDAGAISPASSR
jgi:hypothetical protein